MRCIKNVPFFSFFTKQKSRIFEIIFGNKGRKYVGICYRNFEGLDFLLAYCFRRKSYYFSKLSWYFYLRFIFRIDFFFWKKWNTSVSYSPKLLSLRRSNFPISKNRPPFARQRTDACNLSSAKELSTKFTPSPLVSFSIWYSKLVSLEVPMWLSFIWKKNLF